MGHIGDNSFRLGQTNSEYYIVWSRLIGDWFGNLLLMLREQSFRGPVASIFQGIVICL